MRNLYKTGDPLIWITGGALALSLLMVAFLIGLILVNGLGFFWPKDISLYTLADGRKIMGQFVEREVIPEFNRAKGVKKKYRIKVKQGDRDIYGADFIWINEKDITSTDKPESALLVERLEWGNFIGFVNSVKKGDKVLGKTSESAYPELLLAIPKMEEKRKEVRGIEKDDVGYINYQQELLRLENNRLLLKGVDEKDKRIVENRGKIKDLHQDYEKLAEKIGRIRKSMDYSVEFETADGRKKTLPVSDILSSIKPNKMSVFGKSGVYLKRVWEFISENPRESNTEGGVFPAIFGTVMMVIIMSIFTTPLGVLAAFYLREYAKQGMFISAVRIAVNNLAGVPSIVFGVFGVGFFIYVVGGGIDQIFFPESLPTPTYGTGGILWASLTLSLMTVPVVVVATEEGLAAIPRTVREASLGLGATKFETMWRVVFPAVVPSILTGLILAMARAAGEVAPLMITGVVKLAPSLPIDGYFPFVHLERKFMHLGFHIYDVGFQSPNVDAARPMVYTTTLLLILIVLFLNLGAIMIRNRLKEKYRTSAV